MKELERVRWRCRRGMLELDIVLGRFVERHYEELDKAGREAFDALLDMPDAELWDIITSEEIAPPAASQAAVLKLIRAA
ncbi:MAG TPA: succinate dehydrogenase assembly factor 2 [Gallionellaceae bacterium]|nr:succinate dehydrogenase assembly factor 2 [Gallionellaceae bacterium]